MKIEPEKFAELQRRLREAKPVYPIWDDDPGAELRASQVWTVNGGCGDQPTWFWLIVETLDEDRVNAVPLFFWGEFAGPDDLFVPAEWAGVHLVVSFELEATIDKSALDGCEGRLPPRAFAYILEARADREDPARRQAHNWGWEYLDNIDLRLAFHDAVAEVIETLQAPVREAVYAGDEPVPAGNEADEAVIRFVTKWLGGALPTLPPLPAAADSGEEQSRVVFVAGEGDSSESLQFRETSPEYAGEVTTTDVLHFESLYPDMVESPALVWRLRAPIAAGSRVFVFYAPGNAVQGFIGEAGVDRENDGNVLITLVEPDTSAITAPILHARELVVLVLVPREQE